MNKLSLKSHAKLNLYLQVLNKRPDSYHNITTLFERISLCDKIILRIRRDKEIKVISNSPDLPAEPSRNLAFRSAKLLQGTFNINKGVNIKITKRIPVGSGLGGGSSNAATVLMGLNKLWKLRLTREKLVRLSRKIGADVAFFIYETRFAQGEGRGDKIKPLKELKNICLWHILIVPELKVSTPLIYREWDKMSKRKKVKLTHSAISSKNPSPSVSTLRTKYSEGLTRPKYNVKIHSLTGILFNSLEEVTLKIYPQVKKVKDKLKYLGLQSILMSGSGPAVFGIVSSRREALRLYRKLKAASTLGEVFLARTI